MAKYAAAGAAIRCVDQAIQTHGGNGFAGSAQPGRSVRYLRPMAPRASTAQDHAERVLAQIQAAIRIAEKVGAPVTVIDDLRTIHRRLHRSGLRHDLQGSFF